MRIVKLYKMARDRADAIDRCASLGMKFVSHFNKVTNEGVNGADFDHHCIEMQAWWDEVKKIALKYNKRVISNSQLMDWFFTYGSSVELVIEDDNFVEAYEELCIRLLVDRNSDVKSLLEIILRNEDFGK